MWALAARTRRSSRVPFPVVQLDTGMELDEAYAYRDQYTKAWDLLSDRDRSHPESDMDPDCHR